MGITVMIAAAVLIAIFSLMLHTEFWIQNQL